MCRPILTPILFVLLFLPAAAAIADSAEEKFWQWFQANESRIRNAYADRRDEPGGLNAMTGEIGDQFDRLSIDLTFEYGRADDGLFEFIVSAEGIKDKIPHVRSLMTLAPSVAGWRLIAFRPRSPNYKTVGIQMGAVELYPDTIWYRMTPGEGQVDLVVFMRDLNEDNRELLVGAAFILLDQTLGEYDVMTKVRYISFEAAPSDPEDVGAKPLTALRDDFDAALPPATR